MELEHKTLKRLLLAVYAAEIEAKHSDDPVFIEAAQRCRKAFEKRAKAMGLDLSFDFVNFLSF